MIFSILMSSSAHSNLLILNKDCAFKFIEFCNIHSVKSVRIRSYSGLKKTPSTDTFHAVIIFKFVLICIGIIVIHGNCQEIAAKDHLWKLSIQKL